MTTSSSTMALHKLLELTGQCYPCVPPTLPVGSCLSSSFLFSLLCGIPCLYPQFASACILQHAVS